VVQGRVGCQQRAWAIRCLHMFLVNIAHTSESLQYCIEAVLLLSPQCMLLNVVDSLFRL
jgi:hypothetical protein